MASKIMIDEAQELVNNRRNDLAKDLIKSGEVMLRDKHCLIDMTGMLTNLKEMIELYISLQENVDDMRLLVS